MSEPNGHEILPPIPVAEPMPTPSPTYYGQLATTLVGSLDQFTAAIPDFGNPQQVSMEFVQRKRYIRPQFIADAISALLVSPELQSLRLVNLAEVMDDKQFVDAFLPLLRHLEAATKGLKFIVAMRNARLGEAAQQTYGLARELDRNKAASTISAHVENMKRSYYARRKSDSETARRKKGGTATTNIQQQLQ